MQYVRWHRNRTGTRRRVTGAAALDKAGFRHVLRQAAKRTGQELAVRVSGDHRDVVHVRVDELEPEQRSGLGFDRSPGGHPRLSVGGAGVRLAGCQTTEQLAGRDRPAGAVIDVLAQEHLVGRM